MNDLEQRFWSKVSIGDGCWEWTATAQRYGRIRVNGKLETAHRVSFKLAHGTLDDRLLVLHSCDNGLCVRPSHLSAGTQTDNMIDMHQKRRHNSVKLTVDQVYAIRNSAESASKLSKRFGVSYSQIRRIRLRERWAHA